MGLMASSMHKLASSAKRFTLNHYRRKLLVIMRCLLLLTPGTRRRITMEYHAHGKHDGLGAQLQRIIGINGLAKYLGINYSHTGLTDVSIHPLDGISTLDQYEKYLREVNYVFDLGDNSAFHESKILDLEELTLSILFKSWVLAVFGKNSLLRITHPYILVDSKPSVYQLANLSTAMDRLKNYSDSLPAKVIIHHRQGTGHFAVQPGQVSSREMQLNQYLAPLKIIESSDPAALSTVVIYTDAPPQDMEFEPMPGQEGAWKSLPGYDGRAVHMKAHSLIEFFTKENVNVTIESGQNPLEALSDLANAEYLVLSRSSFGFVAALLNPHAAVYIPRDFWHSPLATWVRY